MPARLPHNLDGYGKEKLGLLEKKDHRAKHKHHKHDYKKNTKVNLCISCGKMFTNAGRFCNSCDPKLRGTKNVKSTLIPPPIIDDEEGDKDCGDRDDNDDGNKVAYNTNKAIAPINIKPFQNLTANAILYQLKRDLPNTTIVQVNYDSKPLAILVGNDEKKISIAEQVLNERALLREKQKNKYCKTGTL